MSDVVISVYHQQYKKQSEALALKLSMTIDDCSETIVESSVENKATSLVENQSDTVIGFELYYEDDSLKLRQHESKNHESRNQKSVGAVWVDFCSGKSMYRQKHQTKGKLPILKACGIKNNHRPMIIDATAGLGQDSYLLASSGCEVLCIEQHPVIAALLADGMARALKGQDWIKDNISRMTLKQQKAELALQQSSAEVIYLDPMYPIEENRKQAKVKKSMQLLRALDGTESDELALFESCFKAATERLVIKRPNWAAPMAGNEPSFKVPGKTHRYDIYKR